MITCALVLPNIPEITAGNLMFIDKKRSSLYVSLIWSPIGFPDLTFLVLEHLFPGTDNIASS